MSAKNVVHISEEAHRLAKAHCEDRGIRMTDWVGGLIRKATSDVGRRAIVHKDDCRCSCCEFDRRHGVKP